MTEVVVVALASDDVVGSSVSDQKQVTNDEEDGNQSKTEDTSDKGQSRWAALSSRACRKNNIPLWLFLFFNSSCF